MDEENYTYHVLGYKIFENPNMDDAPPSYDKTFDDEETAVQDLLSVYATKKGLDFYLKITDENGDFVGYLNHNLNVEYEGIPWGIDSQFDKQLLNFLNDGEF